jgi:NAD(P)-dependent dehydrogenase (short-subunit alcohol dehydrogenase family)
MARGLARAGARVGVLGRREGRVQEMAREISGAGGGAMALPADVLDEGQLRGAREAVLDRWGRLDVLVNAAGGNVPGATLGGDQTIFDLPRGAFAEVFDLNLIGTLLPVQASRGVHAGRHRKRQFLHPLPGQQRHPRDG